MADRELARHVGTLDNIETWMAERRADVQRLGREAEVAAHEALGHAARTGQLLSAPRPSDVLTLGAHILDQRRAQSGAAIPTLALPSPAVVRRPRASPPNAKYSAAGAGVSAVGDQLLAGARGAQDAFTFGLGDKLYAGARALDDVAHGADLFNSYGSRMDAERARDQYDVIHYRPARIAGQIVGTGAQIAVSGPLEGMVAGGARLAQATPLIAREIAMLGGVGGAAGVGGQAISDMARRRVGSVGDYLGAGFGGAIGAFVSRAGRAGHAGAAAGAATSVAQDVANFGLPSIDRARAAASAGGAFGLVGGVAGRAMSNALSRSTKGALGEDFSRVRTWARGDTTATGPKSREYLDGGGWTFPDQRSYRGSTLQNIIESKFGLKAALSKRQTQAFRQPLPKYRVDHALPQDVGGLIGFPIAQYGYQTTNRADPE